MNTQRFKIPFVNETILAFISVNIGYRLNYTVIKYVE